jgi:hypothetical protein
MRFTRFEDENAGAWLSIFAAAEPGDRMTAAGYDSLGLHVRQGRDAHFETEFVGPDGRTITKRCFAGRVVNGMRSLDANETGRACLNDLLDNAAQLA